VITRIGVVVGFVLFGLGLFASVYFGVRHLPLQQRTVTVNTTLPVRTITTK
jgi:hypothetical protein